MNNSQSINQYGVNENADKIEWMFQEITAGTLALLESSYPIFNCIPDELIVSGFGICSAIFSAVPAAAGGTIRTLASPLSC